LAEKEGFEPSTLFFGFPYKSITYETLISTKFALQRKRSSPYYYKGRVLMSDKDLKKMIDDVDKFADEQLAKVKSSNTLTWLNSHSFRNWQVVGAIVALVILTNTTGA